MFDRFLKWLGKRVFPNTARKEAPLSQTGVRVRPPGERKSATSQRQRPDELVRFRSSMNSKVESAGPGKNVLVRRRILREDSGTHDTLKIVDESLVDSEEETGFDPYNTGRFDRSKSWDTRFR